jgi:hypothetical protein
MTRGVPDGVYRPVAVLAEARLLDNQAFTIAKPKPD